jgi:hypothetical protein
MKKLSLIMDDLRVESFDTSPARTAFRGTVRANVVATWDSYCPGYTVSICWEGDYTDYHGCGGGDEPPPPERTWECTPMSTTCIPPSGDYTCVEYETCGAGCGV